MNAIWSYKILNLQARKGQVARLFGLDFSKLFCCIKFLQQLFFLLPHSVQRIEILSLLAMYKSKQQQCLQNTFPKSQYHILLRFFPVLLCTWFLNLRKHGKSQELNFSFSALYAVRESMLAPVAFLTGE